MPDRNQAALDFLLNRRSRPAKTLTGPVPDRAEIETILTAAARSPDHGKLEPWRFIVLEKPALARLAEAVPEAGDRLGHDPDRIEKARLQFADADLAIAVIARPEEIEKVPEIEQVLSAGAVCLALLNAALASGWGANWLTGWPVHDRGFVESTLGLMPGEFVAGMIHIGTEKMTPPDRPRPDLSRIVTWLDA
ncbi:nitroreductase [Pelagovum pacificum]|uniref:Putative NAD(P)H nitroreductase n=1 Tax=Pelagovum pacificum TaxID=2588711 RepID=A0A5C5GFY1_9RHOB|nr:nitroreductase [Pelagovum pacificum]QQA43248.1 nitroreductase [Pelagovum pacificum]TNY33613.1 nitroreductase [Pelagovum pacificum]